MNKTRSLQSSHCHSTHCRRTGIKQPLKGAVIAAAIAAALAPQAYAQQGTAAKTNNAGTLEEVIVTAQRRAERIQDVPIAITALSSNQLSAAGIHDLGGIQQLTPSLRFDYNGAWAQPTIRGVGSALVTAGGGSNVGIYVNNFYIAQPLGADFEFLNVKSVDVLKGPQGTLFGHNTTGGAIQVTTKEPSYDTSGWASVSYGNYNAQRYKAYFTTGLGSHVAVDAGGIVSKGDGYVHDIVKGNDGVGAYQTWMGQLGMKIDFTDNFSALLRYQHDDVDDPGQFLLNTYKFHGVPQTIGAALNTLGSFGVPHSYYTTSPHKVAWLDSTKYRAKTNIYQLTLTWDMGFATLKSFTQYRKLEQAFIHNFNISMAAINPAPGVYTPLAQVNIPHPPGHTTTQEFLLTSNSTGRLKWTAGLFYLDWKDAFSGQLSQVSLPGYTSSPYVLTGRGNSETYSYAAYVDGTYQLFDNWYLSLGTRYSVDKVKNAWSRDFLVDPATGATASTNLPTLDGDRWTPRATLRYTPTDNSSVYVTVSRGYKAGMYNTGAAQVQPIKPETITDYETGYKFQGQRISFDLAAYYYDYKELQVANYEVLGGSTPISLIQNAKKARVYGFEGQLHYNVTSNFSVTAGAAYMNAKYVKFKDSPVFTQCLDLATCGASFGAFTVTHIDLHNAHMVRAPKFTGNIGARYTIGLFGGDLAFSGNFYYTSKIYFDSSNNYYQNGYNLLNLRAQWTSPSGAYSFGLWGKNVTNTNYIASDQATPAGVGALWGLPATYGVEARVNF